jgi:hypothetical protein
MAQSQEQLQNQRLWAVSLTPSEYKATFKRKHPNLIDVFPTQEGYLAVAGLIPIVQDIVQPSIEAKLDNPVGVPTVTKKEQEAKSFKEVYEDTARSTCIGMERGLCTFIAKAPVGRRSHESKCEHAIKIRTEVENGKSK